jgi:hypothetical protein
VLITHAANGQRRIRSLRLNAKSIAVSRAKKEYMIAAVNAEARRRYSLFHSRSEIAVAAAGEA